MYRKFAWIIVGAVLVCSVSSSTVIAQTNIYKLHSLFMYNFTKHVQWKEVGDSFTVGVFGSDLALKEVKENFNGKKFSGKDIHVISITGTGDVNTCQMVYFPKSNKNKILDLFEAAKKNDILFVSEDNMIGDGFPISFKITGEKLGFIVSKKNLDSSGLKMSSALLSLAESVD
jgi:hypothetical protein